MRSLHPWPVFPSKLDTPAARSLGLQFTLKELIASFDLLDRIQAETPRRIQGLNLAQELASIARDLEKFLLFSLENPFVQKGGALDKLCFYSEILLQASNNADQELTTLLDEMRDEIMKIKGKLHVWRKAPPPLADIVSQLLDLYAGLHHKLCRFFSALTGFVQQSRSDENVLFFLLENRGQLNAHLGSRCVEELLHRLFPSGILQLRAAICEGYTRRGFTSFLAKAEPLIEEIEWEAAPLQTNCSP